MSTAALAAWIASTMIALSPPADRAREPAFPGWEETVEARTARYHAIAEAIADVALDPEETPLYGGEHGRWRTAALLVSLAHHEGGFAPDVDRGPCWRGHDGRNDRCDRGRSACLVQIRVGAGRTEEGWNQADLFGDRRKCFRAGLHRARRSFGACRRRGFKALLNAYASGRCDLGEHEGWTRLRTADTLFLRWLWATASS